MVPPTHKMGGGRGAEGAGAEFWYLCGTLVASYKLLALKWKQDMKVTRETSGVRIIIYTVLYISRFFLYWWRVSNSVYWSLNLLNCLHVFAKQMPRNTHTDPRDNKHWRTHAWLSSKSEFLSSKQRTSRKDHRGIASLNRHIILVVFTNCRSVQRVLH